MIALCTPTTTKNSRIFGGRVYSAVMYVVSCVPCNPWCILFVVVVVLFIIIIVGFV